MPEVGTELRDWEFSSTDTENAAFVLEQNFTAVVGENGTVKFSEEDFIRLEIFVEAAFANYEILKEREALINQLELQISQLVFAGQKVETLAEIYQALYKDEVNTRRWLQLGAAGVLALVITGIGFAAL